MLGYNTLVSDKGDCGRVFPLPDKKGMAVTAYNATGSTFAVGQPVLLSPAYGANKELSALAPVTATYQCWVGICLESCAKFKIGKFQTIGIAKCLVADTNTLAVGAGLEVLNAGTYLVTDAATVLSTTCAGFLRDAVTAGEGNGSPVLKTVVLNGQQHTIAAS